MKRNDRELGAAVARLTKFIADEPNPASRADALLMLINALSPFKPELRKNLLGLLLKECRDPGEPKRQRQLEAAALVIAGDDPDAAHSWPVCLRKAGSGVQLRALRINRSYLVLGRSSISVERVVYERVEQVQKRAESRRNLITRGPSCERRLNAARLRPSTWNLSPSRGTALCFRVSGPTPAPTAAPRNRGVGGDLGRGH